jgi:hypothetical protein
MAVITSYATLQTAVADYLARDDLTTFIPNFIQNAENKLYRTLNLRNEETALNVSVSGGIGTVPTDFKALKLAYVDGNPVHVLQWVTLDELYRDYPVRSGGNTPAVIAREGTGFIFGPVPSDFTLKGVYYAKQDPLRTTDPSWYVTNAPEVLLYGSLLEAEAFIMNDPRLLIWREFYRDAVESLKQEEANSHFPTQALKVRTA